MTIQPNVSVGLVYGAEAVAFGTPAAAGGASQSIRRVSSSLTTNRSSFTSAEVRADQQIADMRLGTIGAGGDLSGELSTKTYDDFIAAALRSTWVAGVTVAPADFGTGVTFAKTGANTGTATFAGTGSLRTKGIKVGDVIQPSGLTGTGVPMNGATLRVTAVSPTVLTLAGAVVNAAQQAAGWAMPVVGSKLIPGILKPSFTLEQTYPDVGVSERFDGARIGGLSIGAQPNGMVTAGFNIMAQNGTVLDGGNAPYFSAPTAQTTTGILSAVAGVLRLGGIDQVVVTGLNLNLTTNLSMSPVIGNLFVPDIFYGRTVVTGQVSAYLQDASLVKAFLNEQVVDMTCLLTGLSADFISISCQRVKLTGVSKQIGADNGVIVQFTFQALLASGTDYDTGSLIIQRSN